jgi:hypothetical protein
MKNKKEKDKYKLNFTLMIIKRFCFIEEVWKVKNQSHKSQKVQVQVHLEVLRKVIIQHLHHHHLLVKIVKVIVAGGLYKLLTMRSKEKKLEREKLDL